jgi:hypothetical protein
MKADLPVATGDKRSASARKPMTKPTPTSAYISRAGESAPKPTGEVRQAGSRKKMLRADQDQDRNLRLDRR